VLTPAVLHSLCVSQPCWHLCLTPRFWHLSVRREVAVLNEQRRELEFLEQGGNLLDFDFTSLPPANGITPRQEKRVVSGAQARGGATDEKEKILQPRNGETLASERDGSRTASTSGQENHGLGNGLWKIAGVVTRDRTKGSTRGSTSPERGAAGGGQGLRVLDKMWPAGQNSGVLEPEKKEGIGVLPNGLVTSAGHALMSAGDALTSAGGLELLRVDSMSLSQDTNGSHVAHSVTGGLPVDVAMHDVSTVPLMSAPPPGPDLSSVKLDRGEGPLQIPSVTAAPTPEASRTQPPQAETLIPSTSVPLDLSQEVTLVITNSDPPEKKRSHHGGSVGVMHGARLGDKGVPMPWEQTEGGLLAVEQKRAAMTERARRAQEDCILEEAEIVKVRMRLHMYIWRSACFPSRDDRAPFGFFYGPFNWVFW
jgi:hypothetical protein